ncbi:hypothetical protein [Actibacterium sp. XHP0104]|nr:hypothetical protein [Actibacterium sp. XHP0104]MCV2880844.1 hypothetical protein [Actibacterium sp. XHP0104]
MSNRSALILALLIAVGLIADQVANDGQASMFLARKMVDLIDYLAFWR